ncbi:MAG: CHAT domain-containing protein, partial [Desulfobacterales bacterium]|nr:CHAT domain-containing protein [Desulfobacterales bacterium]
AVIKQRTQPSELPGLAAMMPESAFIQLVNWPRAEVPGDLTVIAGDIEPDAWWAKLLVLISDRFYDGDHDLVVNTASMYGGVRRSGAALASFHRSPTTNHFAYFRNPDSAAQMVRALTRPAGDTAGIEPLVRPTIPIARTVASRAFKPQPVVFVLPGIMGSELQVGDDLVWAEVGDLIFGGMRKIRIEAKDVTPRGIMGRYYGELVAYLLASHNVVPFPYDWRIAVETEADRLAKDIRSFHEAAKGQGQPVRILAHSMGGLLARTLIARHPDLWRDICANPGARLVMLGTPNGGSHAITELLVGQSAILRNLALIDIAHSKEEMLGILPRVPGMLAMLPRSDGEDYFSARTWSAYHAQAGRGWVLPLARDLARAAELRRLLDSAPIDPQRTCYVAGSADATADGMYYDSKADAIRFMATTRGDGRVTWDSGIPPGVPTWYMGAAHGDLAACEEAFEGLRELLDKGTTALLPRTPPVTRAAVEHFPLPSTGDELYPDQEVLTATALGARPRRQRPAKPIEPKVRVRVLHGDLAFARYPVAVGHYAGDTIISAEKALDLALDGRLSRRHQVGLYPGAVETCAVFANPRLRTSRDATPKGAIVVGLGRVGELSAASLNRSFARALLEYALHWKELVPETAGEADRPQGKVLGISSLLIGTGAGGVGVAEVVLAMLQAVLQTNRTLADTGQPVRIGVVELIELWEDRAIQAVEALERYGQTSQLRDTIAFEGEGAVVSAKGGLRRVTFEEPGGWWERLQILGGPREGECGEPGLRFVTMTRRARNEIRTLSTQRALVDRFIEQSIGTTQDNRTVARTLFDLLLPNELKEQALDQDHLVLLVDAESARYPWELLEDRWSPNGRPFAVEHGLLRQLATHTFRESVQAAVENNALVVGDPLSAFPELKGAQQEAEAVCRKLRTDGRFDVTRHIRPTVDQVIHALCAKPYRVLHLAGHGVYRYRPESDLVCRACGGQLPPQMQPTPTSEPVTGMVIGDGVFLTPGEVHQMRRIPELVFINCCHLGQVEADAGGDFHHIAANLATEFINNGVRAVIAAGWAVDDAAADTFAISFYDALLSGRMLGDAVQSARRETFERHARTNTWGAYQCYGDPDYRLITKIVLQEDPKSETFYSPNAAVAALDNLRARLSVMA